MQKNFLTINTSTRVYVVAGVETSTMTAVYGDTVLFAANFLEVIPGASSTAIDLSGATDLRCIIRSDRQSSSELWALQTAFNGGEYTAGENLATGLVTWSVSLTATAYAITAASTITDKFTIAGDFTTQIDAGDNFTVSGSTGNDGSYVVLTVTANGADTDIEVSAIASAVADGNILHSALDNAITDASADFAEGWIEFSWLDANDNPQTLAQMSIKVYQQVDNGTAT
jgi:hypothetical protein